MHTLWVQFFDALTTLHARAKEVEVIESIIDALAGCVEQLGADGMTEQEVVQIVAIISYQLRKHEKRRLRYKPKKGKQADNARLLFLKGMENEILARISEAIHNLFKVFGKAFFDHMEPLIPNFLQLIDLKRTYQSRQYGVCYIVDCIEFASKVRNELVCLGFLFF
ncbi:hypothetical protein ANCCAN_00187 [Ancylostoma caninum]|uniref:Uncharacterized protein n=1 Tax=Ancylostoma caninum TaxID=29170 RepID=A0A368HAQ9_ANCCA|nr:hypothetical protein ANCCAN_00187 [Ancylostoma caninum]